MSRGGSDNGDLPNLEEGSQSSGAQTPEELELDSLTDGGSPKRPVETGVDGGELGVKGPVSDFDFPEIHKRGAGAVSAPVGGVNASPGPARRFGSGLPARPAKRFGSGLPARSGRGFGGTPTFAASFVADDDGRGSAASDLSLWDRGSVDSRLSVLGRDTPSSLAGGTPSPAIFTPSPVTLRKSAPPGVLKSKATSIAEQRDVLERIADKFNMAKVFPVKPVMDKLLKQKDDRGQGIVYYAIKGGKANLMRFLVDNYAVARNEIVGFVESALGRKDYKVAALILKNCPKLLLEFGQKIAEIIKADIDSDKYDVAGIFVSAFPKILYGNLDYKDKTIAGISFDCSDIAYRLCNHDRKGNVLQYALMKRGERFGLFLKVALRTIDKNSLDRSRIVDELGSSPLIYANSFGDMDKLFEAGFDGNARNIRGECVFDEWVQSYVALDFEKIVPGINPKFNKERSPKELKFAGAMMSVLFLFKRVDWVSFKNTIEGEEDKIFGAIEAVLKDPSFWMDTKMDEFLKDEDFHDLYLNVASTGARFREDWRIMFVDDCDGNNLVDLADYDLVEAKLSEIKVERGGRGPGRTKMKSANTANRWLKYGLLDSLVKSIYSKSGKIYAGEDFYDKAMSLIDNFVKRVSVSNRAVEISYDDFSGVIKEIDLSNKKVSIEIAMKIVGHLVGFGFFPKDKGDEEKILKIIMKYYQESKEEKKEGAFELCKEIIKSTGLDLNYYSSQRGSHHFSGEGEITLSRLVKSFVEEVDSYGDFAKLGFDDRNGKHLDSVVNVEILYEAADKVKGWIQEGKFPKNKSEFEVTYFLLSRCRNRYLDGDDHREDFDINWVNFSEPGDVGFGADPRVRRRLEEQGIPVNISTGMGNSGGHRTEFDGKPRAEVEETLEKRKICNIVNGVYCSGFRDADAYSKSYFDTCLKLILNSPESFDVVYGKSQYCKILQEKVLNYIKDNESEEVTEKVYDCFVIVEEGREFLLEVVKALQDKGVYPGDLVRTVNLIVTLGAFWNDAREDDSVFAEKEGFTKEGIMSMAENLWHDCGFSLDELKGWKEVAGFVRALSSRLCFEVGDAKEDDCEAGRVELGPGSFGFNVGRPAPDTSPENDGGDALGGAGGGRGNRDT